MPSRSPSRSDGELLSSDSEAKAKTSLSTRNNRSVNRHTRQISGPRSPASRSRRSRSRSPYRAPRGEKRTREDDHGRDRPRHDTRTFQVRYEEDAYGHRRQRSYDHREQKRSRASSNRRSRSISPARKREDTGRLVGDFRSDRHDRTGNGHEEHGTEKRSGIDLPKHQLGRLTPQLPTVAVSEPNTQANQSKESTPKVENEGDESSVLDEAGIIEERRKRREAMRNKYRGQATPLLVQALHLGAGSSRATPEPGSSAASPASSTAQLFDADPPRTREHTPASPRTPRTPGSPAGSSQDDIFTNGDAGSPVDEGPSAADYDPTIDMQDERARHDRRLFKEDDKSVAEAEQQVLIQASIEPTGQGPKKEEFDMFAEDDDDDMFTEAAPTKSVSDAPTGPKGAQALDERMMDNWDDHEGYYITILGELIDSRYSVTEPLGRGMFASVVRAIDSKTSQPVAIKIVRNNESMKKAGVKELDILKDIAANDPENKKHVVRLLRSFDHKGHLCMVFENMSMNLREVLKKFGRDIGINIKAIRAYSQQLMLGLSLLKKCQYLHADLKPDNILANDAHNIIKIADLGSASPIKENATAPYLVSRFYRAPEVILGIPYDYAIDMWSVGCTLFELYTGKILFTGRNNNGMLRSIMDCRGKFPHKVLRRGTLSFDYFDDLLNFKAQEIDKVSGREVTRLVDIKAKPVRDLRSRLVPKGKKLDDQEKKELELFVDLLDKCLDLRPEKRITPVEALKHPFILRTK